MRAVVMREFGPPPVLQEAEAPEVRPGPGEVVIDVGYAGVTFVETQVRAGRPPNPAMLPALPAILGNGVGSTVAEIGDGVDRPLTGRRVVASLTGTGGYAERAVAAAGQLAEVRDGVALRDAVALLADGRTALALAGRARLTEADTVLVEAAAGGVGTLLVQLARNAGARVVALASEERKLRLARDLGADIAISYGNGDWAARVRDAVGRVDVVFDGVGGDIGLAAQASPRVFRFERIVRRFQRLFHRHNAEALQQFGLAAVPAVERAHADSGAFGDSRDGGACAQWAEDVACRVQYGQVIAPGLGLPTVHGLRAQ